MDLRASPSKRAYDVALGVVVFVGLYQGLVPLVARSLFDADQRFAPALWLPSPWWWIACLAITSATLALLAVIAEARDRHFPAEQEPVDASAATSEAGTQASDGAAAYDVASGIVFLVGIYNGIAPFVARLVFGGDDLLLALPLRLPSPWWWITSIAVLVVAGVLLVVIDEAKKRHLALD